MKRIAIVDGVRSPFIKAFTLFNDLSAQELGRIVVNELLQKTEIDPELVDEVIFGCVANPPEAANVARVIQLLAGLPERKRAMTVSRNCASGFESVTTACEKILAGVDDIVIAGGCESMSNIPFFYRRSVQDFFMELGRAKTFGQKMRQLTRLKWGALFNPIIGLQLGLSDSVCGLNMGETAEVLAKDFGISRLEQDEFALMSHERAVTARERLREEIVPVYVKPKFKDVVDSDNGVRDNQTMEALQKLRPAFERHNGTVTPGNASQITDGASALLLMREDRARSSGMKALGYIKHYVYEGCEPKRMGMGPAYAIPSVLKKAGLGLKDIALIEINEAFACQVIACERALASDQWCKDNLGLSKACGQINRDILNVNGGGIALGHPVGVTGNRLILTLLKEMKRRNVQYGLASLCVGGGQGGAVLLERE